MASPVAVCFFSSEDVVQHVVGRRVGRRACLRSFRFVPVSQKMWWTPVFVVRLPRSALGLFLGAVLRVTVEQLATLLYFAPHNILNYR